MYRGYPDDDEDYYRQTQNVNVTYPPYPHQAGYYYSYPYLPHHVYHKYWKHYWKCHGCPYNPYYWY